MSSAAATTPAGACPCCGKWLMSWMTTLMKGRCVLHCLFNWRSMDTYPISARVLVRFGDVVIAPGLRSGDGLMDHLKKKYPDVEPQWTYLAAGVAA